MIHGSLIGSEARRGACRRWRAILAFGGLAIAVGCGCTSPTTVPQQVVNDDSPTARGAEYECSTEPSLRSLVGRVATTVTFQNFAGVAVSTYWLDYSGKRVFYRALESGQSYDQPTYITHPWLILDAAGRCYKIILPGSSEQVVTIM